MELYSSISHIFMTSGLISNLLKFLEISKFISSIDVVAYRHVSHPLFQSFETSLFPFDNEKTK